jgi:hypothetical protein
MILTEDLCGTDPPSVPEITLDDLGNALLGPAGMAALAQKVQSAMVAQVWGTYCVCNATAEADWFDVAANSGCAPPDVDEYHDLEEKEWTIRLYARMTSDDSAGKGCWVQLIGYLDGGIVWNTGGIRLNGAEGWHDTAGETATIDQVRIIITGGDGGANGCAEVHAQSYEEAGYVPPYVAPPQQERPTGAPDTPDVCGTATLEDICRLVTFASILTSAQGAEQNAQGAQLDTTVAGIGDIQEGLNSLADDVAGVQMDTQTLIDALPPETLTQTSQASGKTGEGYISLGTARAVGITFGTIPAFKGYEWTAPKTYQDLGVIRFGGISGYGPDIPLTHSPTLVIDVPAWAANVYYALAPQVVATIHLYAKAS